MTDEQPYDAVGVVLSMDRRGKFAAKRVFILDGAVVREDVLTQNRAPSWAAKSGLESLARLVTDWTNGMFQFTQPLKNKMVVDDR